MTQAASVAAMLVGCLVLVGWMLDVETLKSVVPGRVAMNPTTAVTCIVASLSLWLQRARAADQPRNGRRFGVAYWAAGIVAVLGLLTLVGYLSGSNLGLDQLLFRAQLRGNRIAPNTGLNFLLVGVALLLLDRETRRGHRPAQWLAVVTAAAALISLLGYAYGIGILYGIASYIPMALNTALAFALLSLGILCARPEHGLMAIVTSDRAGGVLLRRLLPAAIGIPAVLGWLCLAGQRAGLYDTAFGLALLVVVNVAVFATLIWRTAGSLDRADHKRRQAETALERQYREAEDARSQTRAVLDAVSEAIVFLAPDRRILTINRRFTTLFGLRPDDVMGRCFEELEPELGRIFADPAVVVAGVSGDAADAERQFTDILLQHWPERRELELFAAPVHGADDTYLGRLYAFRDVTLQREVERLKDERHRQLEAELARAAQVQAALLPHDAPIVPGFELAARCLPAREVGGDFFDWHEPAPGALTLTLGDVMGKGMPAALLMATARAALEAVARHNPPATAVQTVALALERDLERSGSFITLFHAQATIATQRLEYVDAGHGHVFLYRRDGGVEELRPRGLPLGVLPNQTYHAGACTLTPGDALVIYSDGLIDARPDVALDRPMIGEHLRGTTSALEIVDRLVALATQGSGPLPDDLTVVVLRCRERA